MAKPKTHFTCQACGSQSAKWLGRCTECGTWGSMVEETSEPPSGARPAWGAAGGMSKPVPLSEVSGSAEARRLTGIAELDRVLGGGVVQGSLVLIGGDPGIGKSTLLLGGQGSVRLQCRRNYVESKGLAEASGAAEAATRGGSLMADRVKLTVEMSKDLNKVLEDLSEELDTSKSEVLKRALVLMQVASEGRKKGQKLGLVRERDDKLITHIVGL